MHEINESKWDCWNCLLLSPLHAPQNIYVKLASNDNNKNNNWRMFEDVPQNEKHHWKNAQIITQNAKNSK